MPEEITYASAGVDINEAQRALRAVSGDIRETLDERVLGGVGAFGGLFRASFSGLTDPVLVSSIDGIGTKTKIAAMVGEFAGLGHDIVNHCTNDILCQGARPIFFLDYFGASRLDGLVFEQVIRGAAEACKNVGASLIGGETAEMPGVYHDDEIDIVGTIVGVVDFDKRLPRQKPRPGDALIGLASNGLHTNGYSLARKVLFEMHSLSVRDTPDGFTRSLGDVLLEPHRCYLHSVLPLLENDEIRGIAHITGGGLYDNLPRILSADTQARIEKNSWEVPMIFSAIRALGGIPDPEMYRAFNMGIGMVLVVERTRANSILASLEASGESAALIGEITSGAQDVIII